MHLLKIFIEYLSRRVSNYGFWISLSALIPLFIQTFFDVSILPQNYEEIANGVLAILVSIGICNNPTTESKFFNDDKEK